MKSFADSSTKGSSGPYRIQSQEKESDMDCSECKTYDDKRICADIEIYSTYDPVQEAGIVSVLFWESSPEKNKDSDHEIFDSHSYESTRAKRMRLW